MLIKIQKLDKRQLWINLLPYAIIILAMLLVSPSGPLYRYSLLNPDLATNQSVVKGLLHGRILFKNIFEQRGQYFYWLLMPGMLFNANYYLGRIWVWLIETGNMCLLYFAMNKLNKDRLCNTLLVLFAISFPATSSIGESESFGMPIFIYVAYLALTVKKLSLKQNFVLGLLFGIVLEIKYGMIGLICGFYFGYGMYLLVKKQFKYFAQTVLVAISGVLTAQIPLLIYELANHNLNDYINGYFLADANYLHTSFYNWSCIAPHILILIVLCVVTLWPIVYNWLVNKTPMLNRWLFVSCLIFALSFSVIIGHYNNSYSYPMIALMLIYAAPSYREAFKNQHLAKTGRILLMCSALLVTCVMIFNRARYAYQEYNLSRVPSPTDQASAFIRRNPGPILAKGCMAESLFAENNEYPKFKHFGTIFLSKDVYPEQYQAQEKYLAQKKPKWVFVKGTCSKNLTDLKNFLDYSSPEHFDLQYPSKKVYIKSKYGDSYLYSSTNDSKNLLKNYYLVWLKPGLMNIDNISGTVYELWLRKGEKVNYNPHAELLSLIESRRKHPILIG